MTNLFRILDGICVGEHAAETLANEDQIVNYAEACGESIDYAEARRIQTAGRRWMDERESGNGEWGRMRADARRALDDA